MKFNIAKTTAVALTLLLSASLCAAAASETPAPQPAASKSAATANDSGSKAPATSKTTAKVKLVDINSASKAELKKLPGIDDAAVARIIAGRPYGSKAWLVTHDVITREVYDGLRTLVMAKPSTTDAGKKAAPATPKK